MSSTSSSPKVRPNARRSMPVAGPRNSTKSLADRSRQRSRERAPPRGASGAATGFTRLPHERKARLEGRRPPDRFGQPLPLTTPPSIVGLKRPAGNVKQPQNGPNSGASSQIANYLFARRSPARLNRKDYPRSWSGGPAAGQNATELRGPAPTLGCPTWERFAHTGGSPQRKEVAKWPPPKKTSPSHDGSSKKGSTRAGSI